jgi:parallel beta-helix repeat protein
VTRCSETGIVVGLAAHDNVVKSNTVSDSAGVGIVLADTATANSIVGNEVTRSGLGIVLTDATAANSIVGNIISRCGNGIVLTGANDNTVRGNRVSDSTASGLVLRETAADNEIVGNVVTASGGHGIVLTNLTTNNVVKDNQFTASGLIHTRWKNGINIAGDDNEIKDNDVSDSREDGIAIRGDRNLVVDNKVFLSGRYGISALYPITNDNMVRDNLVSGSSVFDLCDDGRGTGNVWRDNSYDTANF